MRKIMIDGDGHDDDCDESDDDNYRLRSMSIPIYWRYTHKRVSTLCSTANTSFDHSYSVSKCWH